MTYLSTTAANDSLNSLDGSGGTPANKIAYLSLHGTGNPSTTGANEFSGGGYARQAMTWNSASGGTKTNSGTASFNTANTTQANYLGGFSAATAGTFGIGITLSSGVTASTITVAAGALSIGSS